MVERLPEAVPQKYNGKNKHLPKAQMPTLFILLYYEINLSWLINSGNFECPCLLVAKVCSHYFLLSIP